MARPSKYTPELRRRAIEEVIDRDRKVGEVAASLGIATPETLRRWVVQARIDRGLVPGPRRSSWRRSRRCARRWLTSGGRSKS